jgi:hypothetical protein
MTLLFYNTKDAPLNSKKQLSALPLLMLTNDYTGLIPLKGDIVTIDDIQYIINDRSINFDTNYIKFSCQQLINK